MHGGTIQVWSTFVTFDTSETVDKNTILRMGKIQRNPEFVITVYMYKKVKIICYNYYLVLKNYDVKGAKKLPAFSIE